MDRKDRGILGEAQPFSKEFVNVHKDPFETFHFYSHHIPGNSSFSPKHSQNIT